ncbi:hypothetical protein B0H15DRAFT_86517 [Mycena belliarum]|uniref:Uncharacterized protein n=1 Tax=Mycena belliarum TaxID=1033014 RepID=A0AAD6XGM3_9AGAR|nr:hypothetical protein B0H15DRAFT_86517 [Mycena belliae]
MDATSGRTGGRGPQFDNRRRMTTGEDGRNQRESGAGATARGAGRGARGASSSSADGGRRRWRGDTLSDPGSRHQRTRVRPPRQLLDARRTPRSATGARTGSRRIRGDAGGCGSGLRGTRSSRELRRGLERRDARRATREADGRQGESEGEGEGRGGQRTKTEKEGRSPAPRRAAPLHTSAFSPCVANPGGRRAWKPVRGCGALGGREGRMSARGRASSRARRLGRAGAATRPHEVGERHERDRARHGLRHGARAPRLRTEGVGAGVATRRAT